ncbi:MAG: 3-hydroxyacyl-CoA dehydrogenase/enoyl-CoA hydratase family protein [Flavobacteriaceae bacterium]|nr:3-hydroxyacyl-CoA dehydrogenase/enoyl-CoA hydratase family protein [Flavobacteriaceae bacterium]
MQYRIKNVVVLGSGVMGSGIACQLANVGLQVLMLDILPQGTSDKKTNRNSVAQNALNQALKSKPAPLYKKDYASRITVGNLEDDFEKIKDADWIIEVVVERLDIKQQIFEKVEKFRKAGSIVSSNTSSIPISQLSQGRSEEFKKHFCGTHFFNPPRYLRLLEIIPIAETQPELVDFFMHFGEINLGKQTVLCKDTPAFIANRIGVMSGVKVFDLTQQYDLTIEEVDALTGALIGRPNTGTYRLQDLVGLDTGDKVTQFVVNNVQNDSFFESLGKAPETKFMTFLLENNFLGNKTGKGFYHKTNEKDQNGKTFINALDLKTLEYKPSVRPKNPILKEAKAIENMHKRMPFLMGKEGKESLFLKDYFAAIFAYAAQRVPEISDQYYPVDDAMRAGYVWDFGPFEYWDLIGFQQGVDMIKAAGENIPDWIKQMQNAGADRFYKYEKGEKKYFDLDSQAYKTVPGSDAFIILESFRDNTPVIKNSECAVHDIGEGVMCLEFQSKSNAIGEGIGKAIAEAVDKAENEGWNGIVIGNNAKQFSVGANLMNIGMLAMQKQFDTLDQMVADFQSVNMRIRTSKIPVVVATQGYVFGGGCEITMHCDAAVAAAESYIGLVEVGVGLIPGGGGSKEFALRVSDGFYEGDVQTPMLIDHFKSIATAAVSTSASEAFDLHYLLENRDTISYNVQRNIGLAKEKVLELAKDYIPPSPREDIEVLGRGGLGVLYSAINEYRLGKFMSEYDEEIARKLAYVMCGGDLTSSQKVSEQYLLDIEREAFMSLLGNQKTLDRIQYLLMNNKPLRN